MRKSPIREQDCPVHGLVPVSEQVILLNTVGPKQEQGMFANGSRFLATVRTLALFCVPIHEWVEYLNTICEREAQSNQFANGH